MPHRREFIQFLGSAALVGASSRAGAQATPTMGLLSSIALQSWTVDAIRSGLEDTGFVEGRNLTTITRVADGKFELLPALATDLVSRHVSVIFATGSPVPARVAKAATGTIPIVFAYGGDPVADGLVASLNRPGGNVTGATFIGAELTGKRMELLQQIVPRLADVALMVNPKGTLADGQINDAQAAAAKLNLRLHVIAVSHESEFDEAYATANRLKVGGLMVGTDPLFGFVGVQATVSLAERYRIPAIYGSRRYIENGGLISYGPNLPDTWRQAAVYAGRILKGEKPSGLPVVMPTRFETVINTKAAMALGLAIPDRLLVSADQVIE
jgi:putative ABC transport system substrate-binding protein